jgi:hypothetical protein
VSKPKRYRNPSPSCTSGPVPSEEMELHGQRKWPDGIKSVRLIPAGQPPTEVTLYPQGKLKEGVEERRKGVRAAIKAFVSNPLAGTSEFWSFLDHWSASLRDPQVWPQLDELLVSWPLDNTRTAPTWQSHPINLWALLHTLGWRLAIHWCAGDSLLLRRAAEGWLIEHMPVLWDKLDDPARRRVAELLHDRLRLAEAEQRGHRDVLTALESFGRSSRQLP